MLARAAGGAVAAGRRPGADRLQRDVLFEPPALGRAVPDRVADAVALVPRQRDGGLVHLRAVADRMPEADPDVRRAVPGRDRRCCRCSCRHGPSSASSNTSASWSRATRSRSCRPGLFREFRARRARGLRREHQPARRPHPQRVPALGRRRARTRRPSPASGTSRRSPTATASSCWRTAAATRASRARAEYRIVEFEQARPRASSPPRCARCRRRTRRCPRRRCSSLDGPRERAELFWRLSVPILALVLTLLAIPLAYVNPRIGTLVQPHRRGVPVHALHATASTSCRA